MEKYSTPHRIRKTLSSFCVYLLNQTSRFNFSSRSSISTAVVFTRRMFCCFCATAWIKQKENIKRINTWAKCYWRGRKNSANCNSIDNRKLDRKKCCVHKHNGIIKRVLKRLENKNRTFNQKFINMALFMGLSVQIYGNCLTHSFHLIALYTRKLFCKIESKLKFFFTVFFFEKWFRDRQTLLHTLTLAEMFIN